VLFFELLGSDVEIVVKPRPGQRAERGCWSPETCPKSVYIFKLGLEATSGSLTDEPVAEIVQCGESFASERCVRDWW
jgi:hypothetical protein